MDCPSCGAAVEKGDGPGRPTVYCGKPCRRLAEFQIRTIVRRVDRAESLYGDELCRAGVPFDWRIGEPRVGRRSTRSEQIGDAAHHAIVLVG
jgi:hypothetical protein